MPTLEITTKLGCALACRFCPQDRLVKAYPRDAARSLSLADFRRVVAKLPAHVRIDFSGMAEPWLNPDATAMVVHAFMQRRRVAIYTTLQGMAPADAALLIEQFADRIGPETPWVIHLPDADGAMTGWRASAPYLQSLAQFVALRRDRAPAGLMFMTMSASGRVAAPLQAVVGETLDGFTGISRVENLDRRDFSPGQLLARVQHGGAVLCGSTPFFDHNAMLPNGDVVLCCMDYGRQHVLGNLLTQDYAALFAGPAMAAIRTRAMTPDDAPTGGAGLICRQCHNAVCLAQGGEAHWQLQGAARWTARREAALQASPPAEAMGAMAPAAPREAAEPRSRPVEPVRPGGGAVITRLRRLVAAGR